jgi:hypothetical protein
MFIGCLHQTPDQSGMSLAGGGRTKTGHHGFHRALRCHLAGFMPANAIGQNKQPASRARLPRIGGRHVAQVIFVMIANSSNVAELRELKK